MQCTSEDAFMVLFHFSYNVAGVKTTPTGFTENGAQKRQAIIQCLNPAVLKMKQIAIQMLLVTQTQSLQRYGYHSHMV